MYIIEGRLKDTYEAIFSDVDTSALESLRPEVIVCTGVNASSLYLITLLRTIYVYVLKNLRL